MTNLPCPSCGAPVPVRSAALPYVTCPYCQTLIRREGEGLEAIGKAAVLPFDVSPIQLETRGTWRGIGFTVVGRVRWGWGDGSWNEWLLDCSDGTVRWLGEAMGSFMVTAERPDVLALPGAREFASGGALTAGTYISFDGEHFQTSDIKQATCLGSEGDLPMPTPAGRMMTSIDCRAPSGAVLSLQRDEEGASAWVGESLDLFELAPKNLRAIEGWAIPAGLK